MGLFLTNLFFSVDEIKIHYKNYDINEYKSTIDVIRGKTYDVIIKPEINLLHNTINSKDFKNLYSLLFPTASCENQVAQAN